MKRNRKKFLRLSAAAVVLLLAVFVLTRFVLLQLRGGNGMQTNLVVTSEAFPNDGTIPERFTADGENVSPPLAFGHIPRNAKTIAVIVDDPDAPLGTFTHWLIWNIPAETDSIPAGIPREESVGFMGNARQGRNDFGEIGYKGPDPPKGTHTYRFRVYTLDGVLELKPGADKDALTKSMEGHILQYGLLRGKYGR